MIFRIPIWMTLALWIGCICTSVIVRAKDSYVLVSDPFPPYVIVENDERSGILVDLVTEAFRRAGLSLEIRIQPWQRCLDDVVQGKADAIFPLFYTEERSEFFWFSNQSLGTADIVLMTNVDSDIAFDGSIESIAGRTITVALGYHAGSTLETAFERGILRRNDIPHSKLGINMLRQGYIELLSDNGIVLKYLAKSQNALEFVKILEPKISETPLLIGYSKALATSRKLLETIDAEMKAMEADGFFDKAYTQYTE